MIFDFKYEGKSAIVQGLDAAKMGFASNTARSGAYFKGVLGRPHLFREALGALFSVVTSDFKYHPRDRAAFRAWMDEQDRRFVERLRAKGETSRARMEELEARLSVLDAEREVRYKPFYEARKRYFDHVWQNQWELNYLFDPVVTVHPDELFFEAFSKDESSYARVGVRYDLFSEVEAFECGTTNIDFSARLAGELDRVRSYRRTEFAVAPQGVDVKVGDAPVHKEKKIDLPPSWVNGFLQVQSTMTMSLTRVTLAPIDLYNVTRFLRQHKTKRSPRALRFELAPGKRPRVVFEPWEHAIELSGEAAYHGDEPLVVRTWGRDRLRVIARLLPVADSVDVYLSGLGLPIIYVVRMGEVSFTLALSGWTDNDWTGGTKFDLLTRRLNGTPEELMLVYETLRQVRFATDTVLAQKTGLDVVKTRSVVSHLCQVGRAMVDLSTGTVRHRDLFAAPFTLKEAVLALAPSPGETTKAAGSAKEMNAAGDVRIIMRQPIPGGGFRLSGSAKGKDGARVRPMLTLDGDGKIAEGTCTCSHWKSHGLTQGPCEHLLGLRLAHIDRVSSD